MTNRLKSPLVALTALCWIPAASLAVAPVNPSSLRAWPLSDNRIQLSWQDNAADETSYEVLRLAGRTGIWETIAEGLPADSAAYTDTALPAAALYQYRVLARNADGASSSGSVLAITDDRPFGERSLGFLNGRGGYAGAYDIGISQTTPAVNSKNSYVWIDNNGAGDDNQALLHFSGIFGDAPDLVPPAAQVTRAVLRIYLGTNSNAQSYKTVSFHQMLVPWDSGTTWGSAALGGNGVQADDGEARAGYDVINVFGMPGFTYELDVTPTLQAWASGAAEHGWLIRTGWSDGYAYYTTHNTLMDRRPELIVSFDSDPANRAPVVTPAGPAPGATAIHEPASIRVEVSDPDGDPLEVVLLGREAPTATEPDFTVVLLPDTQFYAAEINGATRAIFNRQTEWIIENRQALNIPFVLHMGDITQSGDIKNNTNNGAEWLIAAKAMYQLHKPDLTGLPEGIPYAMNVGNHDQEPIWRSSGTTSYFNLYFGERHFSQFSYYGGHYGDNNDNHYCLFTAGGYPFIVISLEYSDPARDPLDPALLEWADALLKQYPDHRGIIVSHHMVNPGTPAMWSPYGEAIYEVLKDNPNLHLMLGGHVTGEGLRVEAYNGNTVYALVQDYQGYPEGGAGYLRLMTFSPVRNEIRLTTYSPWLDAGLEEFGGAFSLPYDLGTEIQPFAELARWQDVASGSLLEFEWTNLLPATGYEWHAVAADGRKSAGTPISAFRSAARTYSSWQRAYFSEGDAEGDPAADPDEDGHDNLTEFVFESDPLVAGPVQIATHAVSLGPDTLELRYDRLAGFGFTWEHEYSVDLLQWLPAVHPPLQVSEEVTAGADGIEAVRLTIGSPDGQPVFCRIRASR